MSGYLWLKLVHVLSAIVAVGTNVTYFVWLARARTRPSQHDLYVLEGIKVLDSRLANPGYVLLPLTGIGLVLVGDLSFSTFWIATAIVFYVFLGAFAGVLFAPALSPPDGGASGRRSRIRRLRRRRTPDDDPRSDHHGPGGRHPVSDGDEAHAVRPPTQPARSLRRPSIFGASPSGCPTAGPPVA